MAVRTSHYKRTSLLKSRDMFSGEIIVRQKSAAVLIPFQRLPVQQAKQLIILQLHAGALGKFPEKTYPGIQIGSTVVAVYHGHQTSIRRCHQVNLRMNLL